MDLSQAYARLSPPPPPLLGEDGPIHTWHVHKFGGTSVASAQCYEMVADIIGKELKTFKGQDEDEVVSQVGGRGDCVCVVVSAMGGKPKVTDLLLDIVSASAIRDTSTVASTIQNIRSKHFTCIAALPITPSNKTSLTQAIEKDLHDLNDVLKTVSLMKWNPDKISELVSGYGEIWSAQILTYVMKARTEPTVSSKTGKLNPHFVYVDARDIITIDETDGDCAILWDLSVSKLRSFIIKASADMPSDKKIAGCNLGLVCTGFVASTSDGVATTLKRDGSDYSASIFGKLLQACAVTIWTDVDGVLSADPRRVPSARVLPEVSFNEAMELAYFGAKVIHPKTMQPAILSNPPIPIYIRNTFNPAFRGTRIFTSSITHATRDKCVCGFATIENMAVLNVEGSGIVGVKGVAKRLFSALEGANINVVLIAQASSEHSITLALQDKQAFLAKSILEEVFARELKVKHINDITIESPCSIIAAVGDGMSATTGVAGRFFSALGDAKINILSISQGCSERNISAVVKGGDATRALRAVHAAFRLSHTTVRIGLIGDNSKEVGVDSTLLKLLEQQREKMKLTFDIDVQVALVKNDEQMVLLKESAAVNSINFKDWELASVGKPNPFVAVLKAKDLPLDALTNSSESLNEKILETVVIDEVAHTIIFDCTNDVGVSKHHAKWLKAGVHVITANNTGLSGSVDVRAALDEAEKFVGNVEAGKYLREVCVGGSLPVLRTLRDLLNSGDRIRRIDGILSVSFSYIMHRIAPPPDHNFSFDFDKNITDGLGLASIAEDGSNVPKHNLNVHAAPCKFSEAVREAMKMGLMEKDPANDLNNEYTARCLMVLAKELGISDMWDIERIMDGSDQILKSVTSTSPNKNNKDDDNSEAEAAFNWEALATKMDAEMSNRISTALAKGCVPRHVSSIDVATNAITIQFVDVPFNHAFSTTPPGCECVRFFTQTHKTYPLVVMGPAEGVDNTARALLAEMLHLMQGKVGGNGKNLVRSASSAFMGLN